MRIEIVLLLVTALVIANIYTDGKYLKNIMRYKKYYQMAGVAFGAFVLYWLIKKSPEQAHRLISTSNEYIKYLPVDSQTAGMITPILDFTAKSNFSNEISGGDRNTIIPINNPYNPYEQRLMNSGKKSTKRSVSETKKKFVAARQNWKCGDCQEQLTAWFEVDHKIRLEYGGSNHVDNLVALCRECHGRKTTIENL
jgi:5-methylcytosine-specific restriction endonuclease McrA